MDLFDDSRSVRHRPDRTKSGDATVTAADSFLMPSFFRRLVDPSIKTVMLCGCGGGFDFVHSLTLYPELRRLGKSVVIGSYSFGDPNEITNATNVFCESGALGPSLSTICVRVSVA
jgi:hypothetical protein